ncbi:MAG: UDP-N-acetylmuramoyl-L-alanyl-D-glutamate--2,6-diaminopimelate ligase [Pseudomonadota bacterium]
MSAALASLLPGRDVPDVVVSGLALDSRAVEAGDAFCAVAGEVADGHDFVDAAVSCGAAVILSERAVDAAVPVVVVPGLRDELSAIADRLFAAPSRALRCVGVTGTNGKTTVAHCVAALATALGERAGFIGTTGWGIAGEAQASATLTTADPIALQVRLRSLADRGATVAALEVSSHALDQRRADAVRFAVGVFTNLTRDHLDYHGDMAAYGAAKRRLFELPSCTRAVINGDDAFGAEMAATLRAADDAREIYVLTRGDTAEHTVRINELRATPRGLSWRLITPWGDGEIESQLVGDFNADNLSAAIVALAAIGFDFAALCAAAGSISAPAGRLQRVSERPELPAVYVDYAHTPDALDSALRALKAHTAGRLLCVFGCGGDRDPGKRAPMGAAAAAHSDGVWVTSDNPRGEDPASIVEMAAAGVGTDTEVVLQVDRKLAIDAAVAAARTDDTVLIAGKGHEDYQEIRGERRPFSDLLVAQAALDAYAANLSGGLGR